MIERRKLGFGTVSNPLAAEPLPGRRVGCFNRRNNVLFAAAAGLAFGSTACNAALDISLAQTQNMSCFGGVCGPTATDAVLNVADPEALLAAGNVEVTTAGTSIQAMDIKLNAALTWSASSTLALDAYQSITVRQPATVSGSGGLTVTTNDGGSNGTFSFGPKGNVTFQNLASPLVIDGKPFTLVDSLPALAAAVESNPRGHYALANNYSASQDRTYRRSPIRKALRGVIQGLGNTISSLAIASKSRRAEVGLVSQVGASGAIENLRLAAINYQASSLHLSGEGGLAGVNGGNLFGDEVSGTIASSGTGQLAGGIAGTSSETGAIISCSANASVTAGGGNLGGLVGWNFGTITLSRAEGAVSGGLAGGLVGQNEGTISQSFATGTVEGSYPGGLVGNNTYNGIDTGSIENSYSTGDVSGPSEYVGGLVQSQNSSGYISYSYSTGAAGSTNGGFECSGASTSFTNDYWDITTSRAKYSACYQVDLKGVTGLTTKQLRSGLPAGFHSTIWAEKKGVNNGLPYLIANPPEK